MKISVVIPVYGCKDALWELYQRLCVSLRKLSNDFEIIMVEDNCPQNSWEEIQKICKQDVKVKGIHFSRKRYNSWSRYCFWGLGSCDGL